MAVPTNTIQTYGLKGIREDLTNMIYRIDPEETPFITAAGKGGQAKNTLHEWQTDALAAPDTSNAAVEGADAVTLVRNPTKRLGNWTQIVTKAIRVAGTTEAIDTAGRKSEFGLQMSKASVEIRRDMEAIVLANQAGQAGDSATPRKLGALLAFLGTAGTGNVAYGTGGANPAAIATAPTNARTDGTLRPVTEAILKSILQILWTNGGDADTIMSGGPQKQYLSANLTGLATRTTQVGNKPATVVGSVDVYVSDFGTLKFMPNRLQRNRDIYLVDFDLVSLVYLRPFFVQDLAVTGDSKAKQMIAEFTLKVGNEAGLGLIADAT